MKKILFIIIIITFIFIGFGSEIQTISFDLAELYYDQDIISTGIDHNFDFFFPLVYSDQIQEGVFTFNYQITQISGPKTMYVVMVNDKPIQTDYLEQSKGQIIVPIPTELFESEALAKVTIHITLDYPVCDQSRVNRNALWVRLKKDSFLSYSYIKKEIDTIPLFLSSRNSERDYEMVYNGSFEQLKAYSSVAQYIGYLSKGIKRTFKVTASPTGQGNKIEMNESSTTFSLSDKTLGISTAFDNWTALNYINTVPASAITISYAQNDVSERHTLSLSQLGIQTFRTDVVFSNRMSYPLLLDAFGGVPEGADLKLNFSVFNRLRKEGFLLNVFLNDYLIKTIDLSKYGLDERGQVTIPIPSNYFAAYNTLTFEVLNQKSDCDEFSLMIYGDSTITFKNSKPYQNPYINEFPYSAYGKTLYVVSDYSIGTAQNLINLAFEKGRVSTIYEPPEVLMLNEWFNQESLGSNYDSLVFLIDSEAFYSLTQFIDLSDSFNILNNKDEVLFKATTTDQFDVVYSFNYEDMPAIVFSGYNQADVSITNAFFRQMSKAVSDFALLSESGVFSFEIGKDQFSVESEKTEEITPSSFWMKNRLWIVVLVVVIILFVLLSSYNKTSKGR